MRPTKSDIVLSSLEAFLGLRSAMAYLRSISVVFDRNGDGGRLGEVNEDLRLQLAGKADEKDIPQMLMSCAKAAICTHVALLYAAIWWYRKLVEINPALEYESLETELTVIIDSGLLESMREVRNAVFHIRPNTRSEWLIDDVVKRTLANKLALAKIERLLYDATEAVFRNSEALFQEKKEVLMQGYRDALAYYHEHLADSR